MLQVASFSLPYGTYGEMKKLVKDQLSGLVCLLSSDALYEIVIQKESDDSWHYHMLKGILGLLIFPILYTPEEIF